MFFFKTNPPKACPKCGKGDAWRCVVSDMSQSAAANAAPVNAMTSNPVRGSIGASVTGWKGTCMLHMVYTAPFLMVISLHINI